MENVDGTVIHRYYATHYNNPVFYGTDEEVANRMKLGFLPQDLGSHPLLGGILKYILFILFYLCDFF